MSKHRMIGFVVLLAILVIIGQYFLNGFHSGKHHLHVFRSPPIELLDPKDMTPDNAPKVQSTETLIDQRTEDIPSPQQAITTLAWTVQVVTVRKHDSAKSVLKQLQSEGFDAFISPTSLQGAPVYRVVAGPFLEHQAAIDALAIIQKKLNMTGILKSYDMTIDEQLN
ncbi:MAG: SPOR domain-containing protein [Gammaproteobacteria bacterium]|nr:SPOR domain-containing protein [Gammaproteobacteria bacterium]MCD8524358.1 SPOR domain-containing protein [Gammaproteobacteria bacterium]MCD8541996.1 SPOR domain-containing protein [Gammaproteobacteria bacterium]